MERIETSKLVLILKKLSTLELKRFKKFLDSPYHNTSEERIELFELLKKHHPTYTDLPFSKEKLFKKIYKSKNYEVQKMNDLISSLKERVEDFLIVSDALNEKIDRKANLAKTYHKRNIPYFERLSEAFIKETNNKKVLLEEDYIQLYTENKRLYSYIGTEQKIKELGIFREAHESLDLFYLFAKLQFLTEEHNRKNIYEEAEGLITWSQLEVVIKEHNILLKNPIINFLYDLASLQKNKSSISAFMDLKGKLISYIGEIDVSVLRDLFIKFINYGIRENNLGNGQYNEHCLELYKLMVQHDILLEHNMLREVEYLNIAFLAYKYNSIDWGDKFCKTYKQYLISDDIPSIENIVGAHKYFFLKDYPQIDTYLNRLAPSVKGQYYPKIRALVIRNLYEDWVERKLYTPKLEGLVKSYERALYRDKDHISTKKRTAYLNFAKILKKIINLLLARIPITQVMIEQLKTEIQARKIVAYEAWLSIKLNELEELVLGMKNK